MTSDQASTDALAGCRVLEVGYSVAGAFAARLLGDFGADVVKLEDATRPDPTRDSGPRMRTGSASALFEFLNWNKRSVAVDLTASGERQRAIRLASAADILIASYSTTDGSRRPGIDAVVGAANALGVVVHISNFGRTGPYSEYEATDLVLQAMSGVMAISGHSGREPLRHGGRTAYYLAGLNAAYAALAGLFAGRRGGSGVSIDLAIRDCLSSELVMNHAYHVFTGVVQSQPTEGGDPFDGHPIPTRDGFVALQTSSRQTVDHLAEFFDEPELAAPRFAAPGERARRADELRELLYDRLSDERALDVFLRASTAGLLSGVVQRPEDLLCCPQLAARELYAEFSERAASGSWRLPAVVARLTRTPSSVRRRAPGLGADTDELDRDAGWVGASTWSAPAVRRTATDGKPLEGLRVLDLSVIFAVPYLGALLADLGAEVIKIESPRRIDQTRDDWGGYFDNEPGLEPWNRSGTFQVVNRGKRSLVLDLADPRGRDLFLRLVAHSDVVLDNFSPSVLPKLGLTHECMSRVNPRLLMLSNTGYGSTGPWAAFKAQGTTLEATMGLMGVTGYDGGLPARAGQSVPDFIACWAGLVGLMAALLHRERTGDGQSIDVGMYQLGPSVIPEALIAAQAEVAPIGRGPARDPDADHAWLVQTQDGWLAVALTDASRLAALQRVLGVGDGDALTLEVRLREWAAEQTSVDATCQLQAMRIAAGPVLDAFGIFIDPQLASRRFFEPVEIEQLGEARDLIGRPYTWQSPAKPPRIERGAPSFGADNDRVLHEILGLTSAELDQLRADQVIADNHVRTTTAEPLDLPALRAARDESRLEGGRRV